MNLKIFNFICNEHGSALFENIICLLIGLFLVIMIKPFMPKALWIILLIIVPILAFFIPGINIRSLSKSQTSGDTNTKDAVTNQLIQAAEKGLTGKIKSLLEKGTDINAQNEYGETALISAALISAASRGHTETVKVLVEFGADTNARNINVDNALRAAARYGHTETVRFLIDKNSHKDDQNTALILAAGEGHIKTMEFLLHIGIDVNIRRSDGWQETPLISAAEFGKKKAVIYLLEKGADIDAVDSKGMTALDHADVNKRASIVKILKKAVEVD